MNSTTSPIGIHSAAFNRPVLIVSVVTLLVFTSTIIRAQQSQWHFKNTTNYIGEVIRHNSPNPGQETFVMGWLLNRTSVGYGNHAFIVGSMLSHGGTPSVSVVGDIQVFSNIEAGLLYGLFDIKYKYQRERFWLKFGQQDINTDFLLSETALLFTHSSFGLAPLVATNFPSPTYPVTGLSVSAAYDAAKWLTLQAAIFDGKFTPPRNNWLRLQWELNVNEGYLAVVEPALHLFKERLTWKIGMYRHTGQFTKFSSMNIQNGMTGVYTVGDVLIAKGLKRTWRGFFQADAASPSISILQHYFGGGVTVENLFDTPRKNTLGLAAGYTQINPDYVNPLRSEAMIELSYRQQLGKWLSIQPFIDWLGLQERGQQERDPLVVGLRANMQYELFN